MIEETFIEVEELFSGKVGVLWRRKGKCSEKRILEVERIEYVSKSDEKL